MKAKKIWQHKEVLEGMYHDEMLTIRDIAQVLNTSPANIMYWMKKFEIETRKYDIGKLNKGKKMSDEQKAHLAEMARRRYENPENHPMYGKNHSEASRVKMSETKRRQRVGE